MQLQNLKKPCSGLVTQVRQHKVSTYFEGRKYPTLNSCTLYIGLADNCFCTPLLNFDNELRNYSDYRKLVKIQLYSNVWPPWKQN